MSSSFWLLGDESRGFSQDEKERTACKEGQTQKLGTIFTFKISENSCHFVNVLSFASNSVFLSQKLDDI